VHSYLNELLAVLYDTVLIKGINERIVTQRMAIRTLDDKENKAFIPRIFFLYIFPGIAHSPLAG
jgi:hypothetical protein